MSTVYQHQLHAHKPKRHHRLLGLIVIALVLAGLGGASLVVLRPNTKITYAKPVTKAYTTASQTKTWHEGLFSITLPSSWTYVGKQQDLYTIFHFKSSLAASAGNGRLLDVYQDSSLPHFAINRMVPVIANEDGRLIADSTEVSDNCTAYTTGAGLDANSGAEPAKWQGINFLCDEANALRNVVGTGSKDGLNTVNLSSATSGSHHFFFTYTDDNNKTDYPIFIDALNSFQLNQ